ncbi:CDP-alcohol phosphatidyltransferase [Streptomyces sp. NBC_00566]|uniref:CDP-alcohol phosphatidyltransferase n=1 Tax=Streptomyces sp. NBC_00566 TaxID=2975778 RepID=UPI002E8026F8|nr:CDP-alcohol phosphatidyltransferase [Streptomyces sp. NBC_00566]WUB88867.1 CDP-alcohol phosphatidyltransferase [Streptomyces sp. NBC_00566]
MPQQKNTHQSSAATGAPGGTPEEGSAEPGGAVGTETRVEHGKSDDRGSGAAAEPSGAKAHGSGAGPDEVGSVKAGAEGATAAPEAAAEPEVSTGSAPEAGAGREVEPEPVPASAPGAPPAEADRASGPKGAPDTDASSEGASGPLPGTPAKPPRFARLARWRAGHPRRARVLSRTVTVLAAVLVVCTLVMPASVAAVRPAGFFRLPGEAIVGAAVLLALPRKPRVVLAAAGGVALAALTVLNWLDMGFKQYLGRTFNLVLDWSLLGDAQSYLEDSLGRAATLAATAALIVVVLLLFAASAFAVVRLSDVLARHSATATRGTLIAGVVWITCSSFGVQLAGVPLAADSAALTLQSQTKRVSNTLKDEAAFQKVAKVDAFGATPPGQLVPDLRGKDVIFTFIESYGRSAIEDPVMAPGVDRTLANRDEALTKAGYHAKSGWLTSATYGGSSWLGHSTTLSGLWVSNQQRYRTVMASDHLSLTKVFKKTGAWDTVGVMPGIQKAWPEQSFFGLDKVYNAFKLGYQGPKFSWSTMPDQYALEQFQQRVHGKKHDKPVMSEVILTSSHQPWSPIPKMVDWDELGDGSVFKGIEAAGTDPTDVMADTSKSRQEYGKSVQYSLTALTEWLERYGTKDTVLVFLGDHQPIARVSGNHASRDVPISIVAKDPKVLDKIGDWGWTDGLRPAHDAPVWKMNLFRDRFLTAYGSTPHPKTG